MLRYELGVARAFNIDGFYVIFEHDWQKDLQMSEHNWPDILKEPDLVDPKGFKDVARYIATSIAFQAKNADHKSLQQDCIVRRVQENNGKYEVTVLVSKNKQEKLILNRDLKKDYDCAMRLTSVAAKYNMETQKEQQTSDECRNNLNTFNFVLEKLRQKFETQLAAGKFKDAEKTLSDMEIPRMEQDLKPVVTMIKDKISKLEQFGSKIDKILTEMQAADPKSDGAVRLAMTKELNANRIQSRKEQLDKYEKLGKDYTNAKNRLELAQYPDQELHKKIIKQFYDIVYKYSSAWYNVAQSKQGQKKPGFFESVFSAPSLVPPFIRELTKCLDKGLPKKYSQQDAESGKLYEDRVKQMDGKQAKALFEEIRSTVPVSEVKEGAAFSEEALIKASQRLFGHFTPEKLDSTKRKGVDDFEATLGMMAIASLTVVTPGADQKDYGPTAPRGPSS